MFSIERCCGRLWRLQTKAGSKYILQCTLRWLTEFRVANNHFDLLCNVFWLCVLCMAIYTPHNRATWEAHTHRVTRGDYHISLVLSLIPYLPLSLSLCRSASLKMWNLHLYLTFVWISREGKPAFHTDSVFSKFTDVTPNEMRIEFSKRIACFFPIFFFNFRSLSASFVRCLRRCRRSFCSFPFHPHSLPSN